MAAGKDKYSQIAYIAVTESAANTLTFGTLSVFSNILEPKGLIIHRLQYHIPVESLTGLDADGEGIFFGLVGDSTLSAVAMGDPKCYDYNMLQFLQYGTPTNAFVLYDPIVNDFTGLPGGGRLVPADRLYLYIQGNALAAAASIYVRIDFSVVDMSSAEYLELVQSLRILT